MANQENKNFKTYVQELRKYHADGDASEYTYRPALENYIRSFDSKLRVPNDPKKQKGSRGGNKPDFIVKRANTPIGFIETKDIGENLDRALETDQLKRYCTDYPNLILTDYIEFRRYTNGEIRSKVRIGKVADGKIQCAPEAEEKLENFFSEFLVENSFTVSTASVLADKLAKLTRQIRRLVRDELEVEEDSAKLHKLMVAFQKVLIADLDAEKFADMFAQTLAYGFFAARVHFDGKGEFSRRTASNLLPKTNPFLRKLFKEFADENLPETLVGAVDEVVDLLKCTDIAKIVAEFGSTGRNDAVIHFYEPFLEAFDPKLKKAMGVFYTPDAVVDYMVRAVDTILINKFGRRKGLADDKTLILDPALGTGSFIHKVVDQIYKKTQKGSWDSYVSENLLDRIFGFEILMAPYSVAHLNLGLQLQRSGYTFEKDQRLGVFLTNTLEETAIRSEVMFAEWLSEEAEAAASVKRGKPIMVVLGNPPYSKESQNDGKWIHDLMRGHDSLENKKCSSYFECDGQPLGERNPKWLNDDYVKFLRFAHWRIEQSNTGVVAFITNHGYLDNPTFRGMRESLMKDFDEIFLLDLHGNAKKKEKTPKGGKDENVFAIQTGVSICFMVRSPNRPAKGNKLAKVYRADLFGTQEEKFKWLLENDFAGTPFKQVEPESPSYLFIHQNKRLKHEYEVGEKINEVFPVNSVGVVSARDNLCIQNSPEAVWKTIKDFISLSPSEAREQFNLGPDSSDWKAEWAIKDVKGSGPKKDLIVPILYRPFDIRYTYYTGKSSGFMCRARETVMSHMQRRQNIGIAFTRPMAPAYEFCTVVTDGLIDQCSAGNKSAGAGISYLAPLWLQDGKITSANLTPATQEAIKGLGTEEEFFYYVHASINSSEYKSRYSEFLKSDFPRIQITSDKKLFKKLASLGEELAQFQMLKDDRLEGGKVIFSNKGSNEVELIKYDPNNERLYINEAQYFENVKESTWNREFAGYVVLEKWLKDRKGQKLGHQEISQFEKIAEALEWSQKVVAKIDVVISDAGGWPLSKEKLQKKVA